MKNLLFPIGVNGVVFILWLLLFVKDRKKGMLAIRTGWETIWSMLPFILIIIGLIGIGSSFINPESIARYLGDQAGIKGFLFVSLFSSLLQIPGIIAFPIAAKLYESGAAVSAVAVFACASTMASIFTFPLEMKYLGRKFPVIRIGLTYILCVVVGLGTGVIVHLLK